MDIFKDGLGFLTSCTFQKNQCQVVLYEAYRLQLLQKALKLIKRRAVSDLIGKKLKQLLMTGRAK